MKRILLLSFLIVSAFAQSLAHVFEKPACLYQNSFGRLLIDSVTMTDTATVLNLTVLRRENIFFFSRETYLRDMKGQTYPLRQLSLTMTFKQTNRSCSRKLAAIGWP